MEYAVKIYNEYKIVEFRFSNLNDTIKFYHTYIKNMDYSDFKSFIIELHSSKEGLILRHVDDLDFYGTED